MGKKSSQPFRPGSHVIVSTYAPEGPMKYSGLDVVRYYAGSLLHQCVSRFSLVDSLQEMHQTKLGASQQFLYCYFKL